MNEIKLNSSVIQDKYTDYIKEHYDLNVSDVVSVSVPFNFDVSKLGDWNIGVICGGSGSGKSTILRALGCISSPKFDDEKALISNFDKLEPKDSINLLCSVGLCSVPTWLKPYNVLSNGERYRADLAKSIYDSVDGQIILIDEFTSVVDRDVAKSMSYAIQKYIRSIDKKVIFASCHYDILDWLMPDWCYDLNKGGVLERGDYLRRPKIELQMYRTTIDTWKMFKKHHYLTEDINKSASCYVFTWNTKVVAFCAVLPQPSGYFKNGVRGSRTVVLPEFQGMGIGSAVTDFLASLYKAVGCRYFTKTVNPKLGEHRNRSEKWKCTSKNGRVIMPSVSNMHKNQKLRASYCHEYIGDALFGCEDIVADIEKLRRKKRLEGQLSLF